MDPRAITELAQAFLTAGEAVPTSRLSRLLRTGRSGLSLARALGRSGDALTASQLRALAASVGRLGQLKGISMKVGQLLSFVDPSLPGDVREVLALLQATAPASPFSEVEATLRAGLGSQAEGLLAGLERTPVAVGSIGQVHRATTPTGVQVAVKVRHAGIEGAMEADFSSARTGLGAAGLLVPAMMAGAAGMVDEARTAFLEECDFELEAARQERFAASFADDPVILVPTVERAWCGPGVLTTRWCTGATLEAFLAQRPPQDRRDAAGRALFSFYVGTLYREGLFHADPHPGNYAFTAEGRVVVYDFGCVRTFGGSTVRGVARLVEALRGGEARPIREAGRELGFRSSLEGSDLDVFMRFARGFFAPLLVRGPSVIPPEAGLDLQQLVRDKRLVARLGLPGPLLFLVRLRFGLYAVLSRLGARVDWGALEAGWARDALLEVG